MTTNPPSWPRLVSVIIGTYNRPETLRAALASIRAIEGPDLKFEILVGDNGTNPATREVVEAFGGIYDKTTVRGCPAARNLAMKRATGEFIAFLDDDDVWLPGHVRPHIAFLDAHPDYDAVFGQIVTTDEHLNPTSSPWPEELPANGDVFMDMMSGYFPQVGATVVRRTMLEKYGLMDESLIGDSDWDWQLRIAANHKVGHVKTPCVLFRQRAKATFDTLQLRRTGFTRKIFLRHARLNRRRWARTVDIARSYFGAVNTYFTYFMDAAEYRASRGERLSAAKALVSAVSIFPTRAIRQLFGAPRHRRTLARTVGWPVAGQKSEQAERIDIALGTDRNFIPHLAVTVASVVRCTPKARIRFIILHTGLDAQSRSMVESVASGSDFVWTGLENTTFRRLRPMFSSRVRRCSAWVLRSWRRLIASACFISTQT
jgi:glycosyltransferase involved in cell wall biosynthesis